MKDRLVNSEKNVKRNLDSLFETRDENAIGYEASEECDFVVEEEREFPKKQMEEQDMQKLKRHVTEDSKLFAELFGDGSEYAYIYKVPEKKKIPLKSEGRPPERRKEIEGHEKTEIVHWIWEQMREDMNKAIDAADACNIIRDIVDFVSEDEDRMLYLAQHRPDIHKNALSIIGIWKICKLITQYREFSSRKRNIERTLRNDEDGNYLREVLRGNMDPLVFSEITRYGQQKVHIQRAVEFIEKKTKGTLFLPTEYGKALLRGTKDMCRVKSDEDVSGIGKKDDLWVVAHAISRDIGFRKRVREMIAKSLVLNIEGDKNSEKIVAEDLVGDQYIVLLSKECMCEITMNTIINKNGILKSLIDVYVGSGSGSSKKLEIAEQIVTLAFLKIEREMTSAALAKVYRKAEEHIAEKIYSTFLKRVLHTKLYTNSPYVLVAFLHEETKSLYVAVVEETGIVVYSERVENSNIGDIERIVCKQTADFGIDTVIVSGDTVRAHGHYMRLKKVLGDSVCVTEYENDVAMCLCDTELYKNEETSYAKGLACAISIGRQAHFPLYEIEKLFETNRVLKMRLHKYQECVSEEMRLDYLSLAMRVATAISRIPLVPENKRLFRYLPGLTEERVEQLEKALKKKVETREDVLKRKLLTEREYQNCIGFLSPAGSEISLDRTGVHPEHYDFAKRICYAALGIEEETPGMVESVVETAIKNSELIKEIDILAYVSNGHGSLQEGIIMAGTRNLLLHLSPMVPFKKLPSDLVFEMLSGFSKYDIIGRTVVAYNYQELSKNYLLKVSALKSGLDGPCRSRFMDMRYNCPFCAMENALKTSVEKAAFTGFQEKIQDAGYRLNTLYDAVIVSVQTTKLALTLRIIDEASRGDRGGIALSREIFKHPYFLSARRREANTIIKNAPLYSIFFRPEKLEKGNIPNVFYIFVKLTKDIVTQHEVEEERGEFHQRVYHLEKVEYRGVDRLLKDGVQSIVSYFRLAISHPKYFQNIASKDFTLENADAYFQQDHKGRIPYFFYFDNKMPSYICMCYLTDKKNKMSLRITPYGYVWRKKVFETLDEFMNYVKEHQII